MLTRRQREEDRQNQRVKGRERDRERTGRNRKEIQTERENQRGIQGTGGREGELQMRPLADLLCFSCIAAPFTPQTIPALPHCVHRRKCLQTRPGSAACGWERPLRGDGSDPWERPLGQGREGLCNDKGGAGGHQVLSTPSQSDWP